MDRQTGGVCTCTLTCAALDGSDSSSGPRGGGREQRSLVILRAALVDGTHVTVTPHAEAPGHGQVQGVHGLRLHFTEHTLTHCLDLPVNFHLTHLQACRGEKRRDTDREKRQEKKIRK